MPFLEVFNIVKKHLEKNEVSKAQVIKEINNQAKDVKKENITTNMEKEIFEQPDSIRKAMKDRVNFQTKKVNLIEITPYVEDILRCKRLIVFGAGSSYHVAIGTRQITEELVELPVFIELASDFLDRDVPIFRDDVCVFISQSGETSSILQACKYCKRRDALTMCITNNESSSLAKMTDFGINVNAGNEYGITSTKTYTNQFVTMILLAIQLASDKRFKQTRIKEIIEELEALPANIESLLKCHGNLNELCKRISHQKSVLIMGRGYQQASCLEGSLKLKEVVNIHSEGIHSGELKHGPLALIDDQIPIIMIIMRDAIYDKSMNALAQVIARNGRPILICEKDDKETLKMSDHVIQVPKTIDCLSGLLTVIPLQLLSLNLALSLNKNVDDPAGLVKTVLDTHSC